VPRKIEGSWGSQVLDGLQEPRDISVVKSASGAYNSSDLDRVLRSLGVRTVLYAGVVTNACVLLTVAAGYDLCYRQYLLADCTAALSDEDQHYAERFMDNYMAQAVTAAEAVQALQAAAAAG
jgi:nicotinamidase-related amidase